VASESLTALAGSGSDRYLQFRRQVGRFHGEWKAFFEPRLLEGRAIGLEDLQAMPRFTWAEPPRAGLHVGLALAALQLLVPVLMLLTWAAWRLRRSKVV
jgi:ABC-2 type transport system permease protein